MKDEEFKILKKASYEDWMLRHLMLDKVDWNYYKDKEIKTFEEACQFFEFVNGRGESPQWSLQYYGFGEHLTFWSGYGGFIDFHDIDSGGIDIGSAFNFGEFKKIIIESAQAHLEDIKENRKYLFENEKELKKIFNKLGDGEDEKETKTEE